MLSDLTFPFYILILLHCVHDGFSVIQLFFLTYSVFKITYTVSCVSFPVKYPETGRG